jgi:hypothetical protein
MPLLVKTDEDMEALMRYRASMLSRLPAEISLNGIPADYHNRQWFYREMHISSKPGPARDLARLRAIGQATALSTADPLDRLIMSNSLAKSLALRSSPPIRKDGENKTVVPSALDSVSSPGGSA